MNTASIENLNDMVKNFQKPFQELAELNVKTLQNMTYLKPDDLSKVKKPEELIGKQINLAIENGHKALDYMQKSFEIMSKAMLDLSQETKKAAEGKK